MTDTLDDIKDRRNLYHILPKTMSGSSAAVSDFFIVSGGVSAI